MLVVRCVAHASGMFPGSRVGVLVWKRSWALGFPWGSGEWYGYAFGFPDRHPRRLVACGFPDAPGGTPSALRAAGRVRSGCVVV